MQVVKDLRAQAIAFRDPELGRWVPADEYLSGHIRDKIAAAQGAGPAYAENVPALEAVLPKDLGPSEVEARLGAPWIPVDVIKQFATELVAAKDDAITVEFETQSATWSVKHTGWKMEWIGDRVLQTSQWGTDKRCALQLVEAALNQQPPTITVEIDGKRVVDRMTTLAAREKWQAIRDHFRKWIYQDSARRDRLLRIYNDAFNQIVNRKFDGSHLMLHGIRGGALWPPDGRDLAHCGQWEYLAGALRWCGKDIGDVRRLDGTSSFGQSGQACTYRSKSLPRPVFK
jgi:N12 class adenine-specific DNA methylase